MTVDELNNVLESKNFNSINHRGENHKFSFKENCIYRDDVNIGRYQLIKGNDNFSLDIIGNKNIVTEIYKNITLIVKADNRFPIVLSFRGGEHNITLTAD